MDAPLVILRFPDLQPWERELLEPVVAPLSARRPVVTIDVPQASAARAVKSARRHGARYWIWARDWRDAIRQTAPLGTGPVFVSVLSLVPRRRPLATLFLKHVTGSLPAPVRLVTFSPLTMRFFLEMERVPESRLVSLDLAMPLVPPTRPGADSRTVGTYVPFTNESNLNYLMNVAHYVLRRDHAARFLIAGDGPLLSHVERMAKELSLGERVDVVRSVTAREAAACDVFLYTPLRNDHFGPLLHAAAAGRPVVGNELPGLERLLRDGEGGYVVPVNETKPMAEHVLRLLDGRELREEQGARLRTALGHRCSGEAIAGRCEELFFGAPAGVTGAVATVRVA